MIYNHRNRRTNWQVAMETELRCQSCGMPLGEGFFGAEADGTTQNKEFCKYCYQNGAYTQPNITLPEMIGISVKQMTRTHQMFENQARRRAETIIPTLKRWQSQTTQGGVVGSDDSTQ